MNDSECLFLHEEILLLVLRDREGTVEFGSNYLHAMGGAILAELLLGKRIRVDASQKRKLGEVASSEPFGEPVLDECLDLMTTAKKPKTLQEWVAKFAYLGDLKHRVAAGLCRRGILRNDEAKVLLVFTKKVYPEIDPGPEQEIIGRLHDAIFTDSTGLDARTMVLLSLAKAADLLRFVFDKKELKSREERLEQIINGELAGTATGEAIQTMQTVMFVAVMMPMFTATTTH